MGSYDPLPCDGEESWSEAFLIHDGQIIPARIVEDSWITGYQVKEEPLYVRAIR
jgi:hypothetical protein